MKIIERRSAYLLAVAVIGLVSWPARAFHSGGVAECTGCHSMHSAVAGGYDLLVGTDPSSVCLTCHESPGSTAPHGHHISTPIADMPTLTSVPLQRTPGGDFGWLKRTYTWNEVSGTVTTVVEEPGTEHGHNIIAADKGYSVDTINGTAPGGTFLSSSLGCHSCHDPHGQGRRTATGMVGKPALGSNALPIMASGSYNDSPDPTATEAVGLYRHLAHPGYTRAGATVWGGFAIAVAPATYNRTEAVTDTRVAYGGTGVNSWGDWCGSCHGEMHSSGNYVHPVENTLGARAAVYNAYVASGNLSGNGTAAYTSLVPFAESTTDFPVLKTKALDTGAGVAGAGPATSDRVICLSCHRAHASAFPFALRWQQEYEFVTRGGAYIAPAPANPLVTGSRAGIQARGRYTLAEQQAGYYDRPATRFATYQRVLCNKCHGKD